MPSTESLRHGVTPLMRPLYVNYSGYTSIVRIHAFTNYLLSSESESESTLSCHLEVGGDVRPLLRPLKTLKTLRRGEGKGGNLRWRGWSPFGGLIGSVCRNECGR